MNGFDKCWKYAIKHGIHDGQATKKEFKKLYCEHKGLHYDTIIALFVSRGNNNFLKEFYEGV